MAAGTDDSWDERALLLLGALMIQSQHGYQLNDFIERCRVAVMKKPTAYAILDRLAGAGHISVNVEQEGNRPPRKVYTITQSGQALFYDLLRANLRTSETLNFAWRYRSNVHRSSAARGGYRLSSAAVDGARRRTCRRPGDPAAHRASERRAGDGSSHRDAPRRS